MSLIPSEMRLLDLLAAGSHPALHVLRAQLTYVSATSREASGVGLFVTLAVPANAPRLPVARWVISDVGISHPQLQHGGGAVLFIEDGVASLLETFTYDEEWPTDDDGLEFHYLRRMWTPPAKGGALEPSAIRDLAWLADSLADAEASPGAI